MKRSLILAAVLAAVALPAAAISVLDDDVALPNCPRQFITPQCPNSKVLGQMLPVRDLGEKYVAFEGSVGAGRVVPTGTQMWQCLSEAGTPKWKLIANTCR